MSKTILVVDDDQSILSIFEFILQQAGYQTLTTTNGEECLAFIQRGTPIDLAFLDLKMPGLSGIDTFKEIHRLNPMLLVIMMTGYAVDDLLKEAFEWGAYGVIYKPFDVEEVLSLIDKIFRLPAMPTR